MLSSSLLVALAACLSFTSAALNDTVCSTSVYASLGCLTSYRDAASLCAWVPRQTVTLTTTTTLLAVQSVTVTRHAQSQVTVQSTSTQLSTKTVTSGPYTTITSTSTHLLTENKTLTTYVPIGTKNAGLLPPLCVPSQAVSALASLANNTIATACSCIGYPARTTTTTLIVSANPVRVTSTAVDGVAPTTTIFHIALSTTTLTVRPQKTFTKSITTCTTATTVETYAAPRFTHVYGPKAGCADTAGGVPKSLDTSITSIGRATAECKGLCEQEVTCEFVYVQRFFAESNGKPYFRCMLNERRLDAGRDLDCNRKAGVYGVAVGYDALDRGTQPIVF